MSPPATVTEFKKFLNEKGVGRRGTTYYKNLESIKEKRMGAVLYERYKMLKNLKKHLTKLIMGVKGKGAAPDWQLAQIRVMMGRCPFRKDCRQNKAIGKRVEEGATGYGGAGGKKKVLVRFAPGVRRKAYNNSALEEVKKKVKKPAGQARAQLAPRGRRVAALRKKSMSAAPIAVPPPPVAPPPPEGPLPSLAAALRFLGIPPGTRITQSKIPTNRNVLYRTPQKKIRKVKAGNRAR